jgi:hypothetical protein
MAKVTLLPQPEPVVIPYMSLELTKVEAQLVYDIISRHVYGDDLEGSCGSIYAALKYANYGLNTAYDREDNITGEVEIRGHGKP